MKIQSRTFWLVVGTITIASFLVIVKLVPATDWTIVVGAALALWGTKEVKNGRTTSKGLEIR